MNRLRNKTQFGFSLIEVIVTLALGALVMATFLSVATSGLKHVRSIKRVERLHSNAVFLSNMFTYWIKKGENLKVTPPSTLEIEIPNSNPKTITEINDIIVLDGEALTSNDVKATLDFTEMERSVRIKFTLETDGGEETLSFKTTVARRNNP